METLWGQLNAIFAGRLLKSRDHDSDNESISPIVDVNNFNDDDDQRGPQRPLDELKPRAFHSCRTLFKVMDEVFPGNIFYSVTDTSTMLSLNMPHDQRSNLVLSVSLPRNMDVKHNPGYLPTHEIRFTIPARHITDFQYDTPDPTELANAFNIPQDERHLRNSNEPLPIARLVVTTSKAFVMTASIPQLQSDHLLNAVKAFIDTCVSRSNADEGITFSLALRHNSDFTTNKMNLFNQRINNESQNDPAKAWLKDSPRALAFTMGTIVFGNKRPQIPIQNAEIVFADKLSYLIPQVYGNCSEEEYQQAILGEIANTELQMVVMEMVGASNMAEQVTGDTVESQATAYMAFIDFNNKQLVRPEIGSQIRVSFPAFDPAPAEPEPDRENAAGNNENNDENNDQNNDAEPEVDPALELGNEDEYDVWDDTDPNDNDDPVTYWIATVMESSDVTPNGHLSVMLERPRISGFAGPRHLRPFLDQSIVAVNFKRARSSFDLKTALTEGLHHRVKLQIQYSNQSFKDQVRCADVLWRSLLPDKLRIRQMLLAHNPQQSPLNRVDLLQLKGKSKANLTKNFNNAQRDIYKSLSDTPEITLIHGPYGTGKSTFMMSVLLEIVSNPEAKHQVLYLVDSNLAVDDIALRLRELALAHGIDKKIIRGHTLVTEKTEIYKFFDAQEHAQKRFQVSDQFVAEFATLGYLAKLAADHFQTRSRGDPRFVLREMSIAHAMHQKLQSIVDLDDPLFQLKLWLEEYGQDGFHGTEPIRRTTIKLVLNELLASTIQDADIIVCTVAAAAKVNLAANFNPVLVCMDEASRIAEFKSLIPLGLYHPAVYMLAGDHKQMRPTVLSAGRENEKPPFLNPFQGQILVSLFERLVLAGFDHSMFTVQHRCCGEIPNWPSKAFYYGQVKKASPLSARDSRLLTETRRFVKDIGIPKPTNRYSIAIDDSRCQREPGSTSSYNMDEVHLIMNEIGRIRTDPALRNLSIGIISFYKAQVAKFKVACHALPGIDILDGNEHISPISVKTVDAAQGTEYDIVFISFVQDSRVAFLAEPHRLCVALTRARYLLGLYYDSSLPENARPNLILSSLFSDLTAKQHTISKRAPSSKCHNCQEYGHRADNCPLDKVDICLRCRDAGDTENMRGHKSNNCTFHERPPKCHHCMQIGHRRANCPTVTCSNCKAVGHSAAICDQPMTCSRCGEEGHTRNQCKARPSRQMFSQHQRLEYNSDPEPAANNAPESDNEDDAPAQPDDEPAGPASANAWGQPAGPASANAWGQPAPAEPAGPASAPIVLPPASSIARSNSDASNGNQPVIQIESAPPQQHHTVDIHIPDDASNAGDAPTAAQSTWATQQNSKDSWGGTGASNDSNW